MPRRTLARNSLLTFAAQPWNLFEDDPGAGGGGGGGGGATVNEHGYPDGKPVADMEPAHQVAYWKHHARKHEARANAAPTTEELQRLRDRDAALKTREDAELSDSQRAEQERTTLAQERDTANTSVSTLTDENTRLKVALAKGLTLAQASRLSGSTQAELEADADAYLTEIGQTGGSGNGGTPPPPPRSGGNRGGDVGNGSKTVSAGADLYRQRHGKN
ncbi:hypothetical protein ABZ446_28335 [Streptomyces sp. NPDC005813]|uniref:hypothetical protein n=1 Tax=Streptomyces sp. NPDC005813 TaxID=3155592 RepID=UPI00340AB2E8